MGNRKDTKIVVGSRYKEVDGLRAFAAFIVMWSHAAEMASAISTQTALADYYTNFARLGSSGVTLFFIISGFLITGILIDTRNKPHKFKNFYISRTLRILPLYYLGILFIFILMQFFARTTQDYDLTMVYIYHILFISNWIPFFDPTNFATAYADLAWFAHLWSIAVEQQFYLFWPAIFIYLYKRGSQRQMLLFTTGLIIFATLLRIYMTYSWYWLPAYIGTLTRMDSLFMGAALALFMSGSPGALEKINASARVMVPFFAAMLLLVFLATAGKSTFLISMPVLIVPLTAILYFFLISAMIMPGRNNRLRKILKTKFMQKAGEVSYGLYIFSTPVQIAIGNIMIEMGSKNYWFNHITMILISFVITYILSSLSYKYMEKPMMSLRKTLSPYARHN